MCSYCLQTPCDPRCPNAELMKPILYCEACGAIIYEGDDFYHDLCGVDLCEDCVRKCLKSAEMEDCKIEF